MSEELGAGGEEWYDGRLIDVSPRRVKTADDEIQLVTEEAVARIRGEMQNERNERGDGRNA